MFDENPENYQGKYPSQLYEYYLTEADGESFEDNFYEGVEEFFECVEAIANTGGRLLTGDPVEHFDDADDEDRISIVSIKAGLQLSELDPGATLYSDTRQQIFQYVDHTDRGKQSRLIQVYFNFDSISTKAIPDRVIGNAPRVIGSILMAKENESYTAATEYQLTSDNDLRMVDLWLGGVEIEKNWEDQDEFRSFALYALGEAFCEFIDEEAIPD